MRKEYYYALSCIDKMRLLMVTGWYMTSGNQPNTLGDWAKYEGDRSNLEDSQKFLLASWECRRDPVEILNVMKNMVYEFKKVHRSLCDILEIEEDQKWVNQIINLVI